MRNFVIGLLLLAAGSASAGTLAEILQKTPESWAYLDADELNARIEQSVSVGEDWPYSPLEVTLQLFGGDREVRSVALEEEKNRGEGADAATISYVRDGFLDDSVRGDWHQIDMQRTSDGTWQIVEARVAYRCWRGENTDLYIEGPCP